MKSLFQFSEASLESASGSASVETVIRIVHNVPIRKTERYPQTIYLQQVSGVGPITSLYFALKVGNPWRFEQTRDIGAFVGLCPKRDQSGETDKELHISIAETDTCDVCW